MGGLGAAQASFVCKSWQGMGGGGGGDARSLLTDPGAAPQPGNSRAVLGKKGRKQEKRGLFVGLGRCVPARSSC